VSSSHLLTGEEGTSGSSFDGRSSSNSGGSSAGSAATVGGERMTSAAAANEASRGDGLGAVSQRSFVREAAAPKDALDDLKVQPPHVVIVYPPRSGRNTSVEFAPPPGFERALVG
jgi:hypothetical protein